MSTLVQHGFARRAVGLIAVLGLLAAGSLALLPAPLAAVSGCFGSGTTTIYFSNASHTTVVGRFTSSCSGVCTGSGQVTSFYEIAILQCFPGGGGT